MPKLLLRAASAPLCVGWFRTPTALLGWFASVLAAPLAWADPPLVLRGMTFVSSEGTVNQVVVAAETAVLYPDTNQVELEGGVDAKLRSADGSDSLDLTCDRGEYDLNTNNFLAEGNVVGTVADGRVFMTEWLRYEADGGMASSDAPVEIIDGGQILRGGGLRYSVREERLRLLSGTHVRDRP
jgi:lipopolysaccharide export system protein LptC